MKESMLAIQNLVDWVNNNPEGIPSAIEAAQSAGYDRSYLSKSFKRTTGITYSEYTTIMKMGFAAVELRETETPVSEIAERLGYSDPVAFTHAFTHACGCSPTDYRKKNRQYILAFLQDYPQQT